MGSKITAVIIVLGMACGALAWRTQRRAVYEDETLSIRYPAGWPKPSWDKNPKKQERFFWVQNAGGGNADVSLSIHERPSKGLDSPRLAVEKEIAEARKNSLAAGWAADKAELKETMLPGGINAVLLTFPEYPAQLDVRTTPFKDLPPSIVHNIVFDFNGRRYEISYSLPPGKLKHWQQQRLYERMLSSLVFKS